MEVKVLPILSGSQVTGFRRTTTLPSGEKFWVDWPQNQHSLGYENWYKSVLELFRLPEFVREDDLHFVEYVISQNCFPIYRYYSESFDLGVLYLNRLKLNVSPVNFDLKTGKSKFTATLDNLLKVQGLKPNEEGMSTVICLLPNYRVQKIQFEYHRKNFKLNPEHYSVGRII